MLREERTQEGIFKKCNNEGSFQKQSQIDKELINTMRDIALKDLETVKKWSVQAGKDESFYSIRIIHLHEVYF